MIRSAMRHGKGWITVALVASLCACDKGNPSQTFVGTESAVVAEEATPVQAAIPKPTPAPQTPVPTLPAHADPGTAGTAILASELGMNQGVLIGLRAETTEDTLTSTSDYRTILVSDDGEGLRERQFDRVIITPKSADSNEIWSLEPVLQQTPTDTIQYIVAHPLEDPARSRTNADQLDESIVLSERLTYVGDDMVSLQVGASYWAGNGNAYSQSAWVKTFDQINADTDKYDGFATRWSDNAHLRIQDTLGKKQTAAYRNEETVKAMEAEQGGLKLAQPLGDHWIIERDGHRWTPFIAGLFDYPGSLYAKVALPAPLLSTVQPIEETPNWTPVMLKQPNVTDTFLSGDRNYILMQTDTELLLYAYIDDASIGKPIWTLKLKARETIIMCKWFAGETKPEWADRIANAYEAGPYSYPGYTKQQP
ncbi:hypothetical protein [Cohnella yongneupensis]|uniref:Uncharacterized protein n=1 Tax=Cohnella yongneupensis TaxID=425006 RepID=A0ABW0R387_9BACL